MIYKVTPYNRRDAVVGAPVYIRAISRKRAVIGGTLLLRFLGQRGRFTARAVEYNPLFDLSMSGYVREVSR